MLVCIKLSIVDLRELVFDLVPPRATFEYINFFEHFCYFFVGFRWCLIDIVYRVNASVKVQRFSNVEPFYKDDSKCRSILQKILGKKC